MTGRQFTEFDKRRIAAALAVPETAPALQNIESALRRFWRAQERESKYENLKVKGRKLRITYRKHARRGAPQKSAARAYAVALVAIHQTATGRRIRRIVDWDSGREKRHPFLALCFKIAGAAYPPRIIREVLQEKS